MGFMAKARKAEWKAIRDHVLTRDDYTCAYCGTRQLFGQTVDHIVPKRQGGTDSPDNCVCCCSNCNTRKGNRRPDQAGFDCSHTVVKRRLQRLYHGRVSA